MKVEWFALGLNAAFFGLVVKLVFGSAQWTLFHLHPVLMTLAFLFLIRFGFYFAVIKRNIQNHINFQFGFILCVLVGAAGIYFAKNAMSPPSAHYVTYHSWTGGLAILCTLVQAVIGYQLGQPSMKMSPKRAQFKGLHGNLGGAIYLLGITALVLSCYSSWFSGKVTGWLWIASVTIIAVTGLQGLVMFAPKDDHTSKADATKSN
jgi:hypothetical protein